MLHAADPETLRRRAGDTRRRAREAMNADLRHQMLEIAEAYETLADTLEEIDGRRAAMSFAPGDKDYLPAQGAD